MKIGILTHYDVNNQGAQLQLYGMYQTLKKMGHDPLVLTYVKNFDFNRENKLKYQPSVKSIPYYLKSYLIERGIGATLGNYKKLKINRTFRKDHFQFDNYATADIDMAIVGSDEVFSIQTGVNMMMYGHVVNTSNMISYAPAFGQTDMALLEKHHAKNLVATGLSQFKALSARDRHTAEMIELLTNTKPTMVCDPAILYDFSSQSVTCKKINKKYMVIYAYDFNINKAEEIAAIRAYAKKHQYITVSPGTYHKWCDKNISCDALEWLEIFKNAECVVTDTFHGTIASLITNTPMAVLVRDTLNANKMTDLLERTQITERRVSAITEEELDRILDNNIDFKVINSNLKMLRNKGIEYLESAIALCKEGTNE